MNMFQKYYIYITLFTHLDNSIDIYSYQVYNSNMLKLKEKGKWKMKNLITLEAVERERERATL